jgi:magnesium chelatase family protein
VPPVKHAELTSRKPGEPSALVRERVLQAREVQRNRLKDIPGKFSNADMEATEINKFCRLNPEGEALLRRAMESLGLSARAYDRILKVSRTIADMSGAESIAPQHLSEAIQYRSLDRLSHAVTKSRFP